ncbi:SDR family NAD(P)-dependent oxidoreductase [uncultured Cohaesibacter sp.]|uniref:SDR family NAD(P)-dependent oxidoreductase n=1 Tax=uncultured Cohaesibacter sp. TaxID=1002546 RepID=UPI0029C8261E|nr:SDR family NAD(P)-dependent oxidoreductase [uncultured Cohaesibacter sp.]
MSQHLRLWNRVWIIGASSGIGAALVRLLARSCPEIFVSARSIDKLEGLAQECAAVRALPLDVGNPEDVSGAVRWFEANGGLPDLTIYCAAIYQPGGIEQLTLKAAQAHMHVNYLGAVSVLEALYPGLKAKGGGSIAIVASLTSYCGLPQAALYGPTKAALASLCETIRPELDAAGIRLQLINPGFVDTPMTEKNSFAMPFLLSPQDAAERIVKGLEGSAFEIAFPLRLVLVLRLLRRLPYGLYFRLMRRML